MQAFGIPCEKTNDLRRRRAISWQYHVEIVKATPKPKHWLAVRMEDFVLDQDRTLQHISRAVLGHIPLAKVLVTPEAVGRWKLDKFRREFTTLDFLFQAELIALGYKLPGSRRAASCLSPEESIPQPQESAARPHS